MSWLEAGREEEEIVAEKIPLQDWEGLMPETSNENYHKRSELSSSDIKHMLISPLHFRRLALEKSELNRPSNSAFDLGTAAHSCYLEQTTDTFVSGPDVDRRTKKGKQDWADFVDANSGRIILPVDQHDRVLKMFDKVASNERASLLASMPGSIVEQSFLYLDEATGLRCKFRPDILNGDEEFIADYKTAISASPHEFAKAVARYHYHISAAHYIAGVERLTGKKIRNYKFVVQEKDEPFAVAIYDMTAEDIERSLKLRAQIMKRIAQCKETNSYPDWSATVRTVSIPGYGFEFKDTQ